MSVPNLVRRFYGTDSLEERNKGEICECIGACQYPQYLLVDANGTEFWWCQHLTKEVAAGTVDQNLIIEYWQARVLRAERKLRDSK